MVAAKNNVSRTKRVLRRVWKTTIWKERKANND